jgi:hypothetical protein
MPHRSEGYKRPLIWIRNAIRVMQTATSEEEENKETTEPEERDGGPTVFLSAAIGGWHDRVPDQRAA